MEKLKYSIDIAATRQHVWNIMLNPKSYQEWTNVAWPNSSFIGTWKKGSQIKFVSNNAGGTLAHIVEFRLFDYILAEHIAILLRDGSEDRTSDLAKGWVGTSESYTFTERDGITTLDVEIQLSNSEWAKMFEDSWPKALDKLKELSEHQTIAA